MRWRMNRHIEDMRVEAVEEWTVIIELVLVIVMSCHIMQYATTDHHVTTFWPSFTHFGMLWFVMLFKGGNFFASENTEALMCVFSGQKKSWWTSTGKINPWLSCHVMSHCVTSRHMVWYRGMWQWREPVLKKGENKVWEQLNRRLNPQSYRKGRSVSAIFAPIWN